MGASANLAFSVRRFAREVCPAFVAESLFMSAMLSVLLRAGRSIKQSGPFPVAGSQLRCISISSSNLDGEIGAISGAPIEIYKKKVRLSNRSLWNLQKMVHTPYPALPGVPHTP